MATQRAVPAKNFGSDIVGIVGRQPAFGTMITEPLDASKMPNADAGMLDKVVEFRPPYSLIPMQEFYNADRMKGSASPDDMVEGMKSGGGVIHFYADALQGGFWIKVLLNGTVTSAKFAALAESVLENQALAGGTKITVPAAEQPKTQLGKVTADPVPPSGLNSVQLELTLGGSHTLTDDLPLALVGRDLNNSVLRETVTIAKGTTSKKTRRWYSEINTVTPPDTLPITGSPTLSITGDPELYDHQVAFTRSIGNGLTLEVREGNPDLPVTYGDVYVLGGSLVLENVARMLFRVFANQVFTREGMARVFGEATDLTNFGRYTFNSIPKWGMSLTIESEDFPEMDRVYPVEMVGFYMNQTLAPPDTAYAESIFYPKVVRKGNRGIGWNAVVDHTLEANFDQFVGGPRFKSIVTAVSKPFGGRYSGIVFEAGRTQMTSFPRRVTTRLGEIKQVISGRATGQTAKGNDEGKMRVINEMATL